MPAGLVGQFDLALKTDIQALANMTEQNEAGLKFDSSGEFMRKFQREDKPHYFQLLGTNGSTLYCSPSLNENVRQAQWTGTLAAPRFWNVILPDGQSGRAAGIRLVPKEEEDTPRTPDSPPPEREVTIVATFHRAELDVSRPEARGRPPPGQNHFQSGRGETAHWHFPRLSKRLWTCRYP